jgi:uncharacterized repeat protein (TIGR03803 family)
VTNLDRRRNARRKNARRKNARWKKACAGLFFSAAIAIASSAQTVTTFTSFDKTDGRDPGYPAAPFVQGTNGNLYGTAAAGGANDEGTVFEISPAGKIVTLYSFCSQSGCSDGAVVNAGLVQGTDGNFYGTTALGGTNNGGTIFTITPAGKLTTLYRFCSSGCLDGAQPAAGLLQASDGNFYGTTYSGGTFGAGTVFKITKSGTLTTLANFDGVNGQGPDFGSLIQANDGNFYGTTITGGANASSCGSNTGCGTVFRMTPRGQLTSLYSFCAQPNCTDGFELFGGLVQGTNGNFYGTTAVGGTNGVGTVFEITPAGKLTTLHSFDSTDGSFPEAAPVQGTDGNFYGTTSNGGANGFSGTLFQITLAGTLTTLYSFCSKTKCADGTGPFESLMQATNGDFYGATFAGGRRSNCIDGCGTAFRLSMGLGPFIETRPSAGKAGFHVMILGNNLSGTTAVAFNGAPATFTVISETEIEATVPAGATTGFVTAATSSGTLTSNQKFHVIQ